MKKKLMFIGLDVHAKNITVAIAEGGGGEVRLYGTIPNDLHALGEIGDAPISNRAPGQTHLTPFVVSRTDTFPQSATHRDGLPC